MSTNKEPVPKYVPPPKPVEIHKQNVKNKYRDCVMFSYFFVLMIGLIFGILLGSSI